MNDAEKRAALVRQIHDGLQKFDLIEVKKADLARIGIPVKSEAYADWLWESGLRMLPSRGKYQAFVHRVPPMPCPEAAPKEATR
jgi:hypothetical protein